MRYFANRKEKYVKKIDALSKIIYKMMSDEESQYVMVKKYVALSEQMLTIDIKKSYRYLKKAYIYVCKEAEIANTYHQSYDILEFEKKLEDVDVSKVVLNYLKAMTTGDLKKAKKYANRLYLIANSSPIPKSIDVNVCVGECVSIALTNNTAHNLLIESISITSLTVDVSYPFQMSNGILPRHQLKIPLTYSSNMPFKIDVSIQYLQGTETRNRHFELEMPQNGPTST